MFDTLKSRIYQGEQAIPDIRKATIGEKFRGLPLIDKQNCSNCGKCSSVCPTNALTAFPSLSNGIPMKRIILSKKSRFLYPLPWPICQLSVEASYIHPMNRGGFTKQRINQDVSIDLGKCIFCGDCERECPNNSIKFTNFHKVASTSRENLVVDSNTTIENYKIIAIKSSKQIKKLFGKSLKLRQVSAGGCNGCEMELNACSNVNFDMGRFGIDIVASPRHADGIIITGPITENMADALEDAYRSTPDPKIIILAGACAISGGVFQNSDKLKRDFIEKYKIDLYIPGCPVHPLTVINGFLDLISY